MSELPNTNNNFRATLDYDLSLANLNAIFGGMWDALQPYRDVVVQADAAINALNARTLQVIGDSITPELDALRASTAEAQNAVDALIGNNFAEDLAGKLAKDQNLDDLPDKEAARTALELKPVATKDFATLDEAQAGEDNTKPMTPLRTAQAIAALSAGNVVKEVFTASGTFLKEEDDLFYFVEVIGAGGSGSVRDTTDSSAWLGGFGGQVFSAFILAVDVAASTPITIGSGGAQNNGFVEGYAGGDSSFGDLVAKGGRGGKRMSTSSGAAYVGDLAPLPGQSWRLSASDTFNPLVPNENAPSSGGSHSYGPFNDNRVNYSPYDPVFYGRGGDADWTEDGNPGNAPGGGGGSGDDSGGAGARGEVRVWRFKV